MDLPDPEGDTRSVPAQVDEQAYEDLTEQLHDSENEEEEDLEATDPEGSYARCLCWIGPFWDPGLKAAIYIRLCRHQFFVSCASLYRLAVALTGLTGILLRKSEGWGRCW